MKRLVYPFLFLFFYLLALLWTLPADLAAPPLLRRLIPNLSCRGFEGTWRHGRALDLTSPYIELARLRWDFLPRALLGARLGISFHAALKGGKIAGEIGLSPGTVNLSALSGSLPLAAVKSPLPLRGELLFDRVSLVLKDNKTGAAAGDLRWKGAGFGDYGALGTVRASLRAEDGGISAALRGEDGLDLAAELRLSPDRRIWLKGTARPVSPAQESIFAFLGQKEPDGRVRLQYNLDP